MSFPVQDGDVSCLQEGTIREKKHCQSCLQDTTEDEYTKVLALTIDLAFEPASGTRTKFWMLKGKCFQNSPQMLPASHFNDMEFLFKKNSRYVHFDMMYPLVMTSIALENFHASHGKMHYFDGHFQ